MFPNKEFLYLVLGIGNSMTAASAGYNLSFSAGCMFVGAIYGLKMMGFAMLGIVNLVLSYLFSPINMIITDKPGKSAEKDNAVDTHCKYFIYHSRYCLLLCSS